MSYSTIRSNHIRFIITSLQSTASIVAIFLRLLMYSYCNQDMGINWNGAFSDSITVRIGVKQGGALSPLWFNVYLDELLLTMQFRC